MKINRKPVVSFTPQTIEITFESQAEVIAFYSVFNHTAICNAAQTIDGNFDASAIRLSLGKVDYSPTFERFKEEIKRGA